MINMWHMWQVSMLTVVDISAKAIVLQCEFLVRQILQVFIYSETVSVSLAVYANI